MIPMRINYRSKAVKFSLSSTAVKGSFVYDCAHEALFLVKLSLSLGPRNAANRALDVIDCACIRNVEAAKKLSELYIIVNDRLCKPDALDIFSVETALVILKTR
jgi:hypothetical protein